MLRIRNTLTRRIEEIRTLEPGVVRMYTCGPTVYRYAHIGNLRTYLMADWLRRALECHGNRLIHVKNITDVGHMRQELLEQGGDKVILAALAEGKTPQEIAQFYARTFHEDEDRLNILPAHHFPWATDHIQEMIDLVARLVKKGYAYEAGSNVYFDVGKFTPYGRLSGNLQQGLMEGVRAEVDPHKRDTRDFALWKAAEPGREMKWPSPWGDGFPGWHIECSAMSTKYMGEQLDIHTGGVDNIFPHHEDEIAQSEAAFGKQYVSYWVHGQHLLADGVKMAKSAGNVFILDDLVQRGFDPVAFRYLCLTVRYRNRMNFTFAALKGAQGALSALQDRVSRWKQLPPLAGVVPEVEGWRDQFWGHVDDDLDLPNSLAITWKMVRSSLPGQSKLELLLDFDLLLGLGLDQVPARYTFPLEVGEKVQERNGLRIQGAYAEADGLRSQISSEGYVLEDARADTWVRPKTSRERFQERFKTVSSPKEVASLLDVPSSVDYSIILVASDYLEDVQRCTQSALQWADGYSAELVAVDNGSTDGTADWLEELRRRDHRVRLVHCDHVLGDAAAKNIGLMQSLGERVVILDPSVEVVGDFLGPIGQWLSDEGLGLIGPWGLRTQDLRHFHEEMLPCEVDAMQAYCVAFRRCLVNQAGPMRECFRFYRNLDLDFSFQVKELGYRIRVCDNLPMVRHEHRQWAALDEAQRNELSQKNFKRFFKRWGERTDLLVAGGQHQHPH